MAPDYSDKGITFSLLPQITGGKLLKLAEDCPVENLLLDSRKTGISEGTLFFAIKGERHNGHQYIDSLYQQGIRQFVIEEISFDLKAYPDANFILVVDSITALQAIVAFHRSNFSIPVIGITGSNGKTIIKEWLFQLLSKHETLVKNPGSYNSQIGVPLSVWQIQSHHTVGIFEAGISRQGEMENLQKIIKPTLGIFTNIGSAHDEGFKSRREKIKEKLKLFKDSDKVVYCRDHTLVHEVITEESFSSISWGFSAESDIKIRPEENGYSVKWGTKSFVISTPFKDTASIENSLHVIAMLLVLGYEPDFIQQGLTTLKTIPMRLELKEAINQCQLIDDTYNNDLAGIEMSLQFLVNQSQKERKTVILSDILESGLPDKELVLKISELIDKNSVDTFIGIGPSLKKYGPDVFRDGIFYTSTEDFLAHHQLEEFNQEVILVKGARVFGFEKITKTLQRKIHGTIMEIDLNTLVHNFNFIKSKLSKSTKVMVMVKAFAYGSGSTEVANLLQYHQADYLGVAYPDEGVDLRKNNISLPIMVMNSYEESFEQLLTYNLEPEIYSFYVLNRFIRFLQNKPFTIHIKLDTGMRRLGFESSQIDELIQTLKANTNIRVASIFSHLAGADDKSHDSFSIRQANLFVELANKISNALEYKPFYHLLNTPGILRLPQFQFDMVRLGIGLYGVDPTEEGFPGLKPVATLKTIISQVKEVKKGDTIGYGRKGIAERDMATATIAIGYADGFSRAFSRGVGKVLIAGQEAPVVGNVCMDMTMVDITGIPAAEGDDVIIFSKDFPIQRVASWIQTIPYEILTNTSERVKRIFTAESL